VTLLECRGLTKAFGALLAVNDLHLTLGAGEILGIIGPNGAGKSTLFNLIAGLTRPSAGVVRFRGQTISGLPPHVVCRLGVAKTFQIPQLFPRMTVLDNPLVAALYGRGLPLREARRHAEEWLDFVGLGPKAGASAATLTLGERRRLDLARVLATGAEVLLLDENMAGLGPREVEVALQLLRRVRERGRTLMVIEHIMRAIVGIADRVVVLNYGQKLVEGEAAEVMRDPSVVKAYLGEAYA
jgi:branched-chain amino acid transport system ATP-binding protein